MVVVRPAQPKPVLPRLLNAGRRVARFPVLALDFKHKVTRKVARARQLDHTLESRLGGTKSLLIVIEPAFACLPEVAGGQSVASRVRLHPALAGQITGKRLEPQIASTLDHGQGRPSGRESARRDTGPSDSQGLPAPGRGHGKKRIRTRP